VECGAGIGAEADDVAGVGWYFWLEKDDGDHGCSFNVCRRERVRRHLYMKRREV
jgi:hypothetical protein